MTISTSSVWLVRLTLVFSTVGFVGPSLKAQTAGSASEQIATPPEIIVNTTPAGSVFADPKGYTLYVTERDTVAGTSTCTGSCATEWPPVRVGADAAVFAFGAWTLVPRDDGASQWAYRGRPLYRYRHEARTGWAEAQSGLWRIATISPFPVRGASRRSNVTPRSDVVLSGVPGGISGEGMASGMVLTDWKGMTLYSLPPAQEPCVDRCLDTWNPLIAPMAAVPHGDWTLLSRTDGTMQWVYNGLALYGCVHDVVPGDTRCEGPKYGSGSALRWPSQTASAGAAR